MPPGEEALLVVLPEAFENFYRREYRPVVALAYALSGSRSGAEDLAQEAFIVAHRQWDRVGRFDRPDAWIRRVVANMAVSAYRRRVAEMKALSRLSGREREALPELEPEDAEFWAKVRRLPDRQAQAVTLFYLEDRPVAEIATIMNCTENTAKAHLHKARKNLASMLGVEA